MRFSYSFAPFVSVLALLRANACSVAKMVSRHRRFLLAGAAYCCRAAACLRLAASQNYLTFAQKSYSFAAQEL